MGTAEIRCCREVLRGSRLDWACCLDSSEMRGGIRQGLKPVSQEIKTMITTKISMPREQSAVVTKGTLTRKSLS